MRIRFECSKSWNSARSRISRFAGLRLPLLSQLTLAFVVFFAINISTLHCANAATGGQTITLDGKLTDASGTSPLLDTSVVIDIKIYNPTATCVLYEEHQTIDTTATEGRFTLLVGSATGNSKRTGSDVGNPMVSVFSNYQAIAGSCGTYTPVAGDTRLMRVTVSPSTTGNVEVLSPDTIIDQVPNALVAETLQGLDRDHVLAIDVSTYLNQSNVANIFSSTNYPLLTALLAGTGNQYVTSSPSGGARIPSVTSAPSAPSAGQIWFNSSANAFQFYNGASVQTLGVAGSGISTLSTVAPITASGVAGGVLNSGGTIGLANSGVSAGSFAKITVNAQGLVTYGTGLVEGDIPMISSAGRVSGNAITSGIISGTTSIVSSGNITVPMISTGVDLTRQIQLFDPAGGSTHKITISAPTLATDYSIVFPATVGTAGYALTTDGSGNLSWANVASNTLPGLASGKIWIGNSSGVATAITPNGDINLSIAGSATVTQIQGFAVSPASPTASGQVLRWDQIAKQWIPNQIAMSDLRSTITGTSALASCTNAQTLVFNSVADSLLCSSIAIANNQISWSATGANLVFAGPSTGGAASPTFRTLTAADLPPGIASQWNTVASTINYLAGFVGVGTATPQTMLDVYGTGGSSAMLVPRDSTAARPTGISGMLRYNTTTAKLEAFAGSTWQSLDTSSGSAGAFINGGNSFGTAATLGTTDLNNLQLLTNGSPRLTLMASGNIGIASTAPAYPLDVGGIIRGGGIYSTGVFFKLGASSATGPAFSQNGDSQTGMFLPGSGVVGFTSASIEAMRINTGGNVGIGTSSPQAILDINGSGTSQSAMIVPRDSTAARPTGINGMLRYNTTNAQLETYSSGLWAGLATGAFAGGASQWTTSGTNIYYGSGNVGVGTANPTALLTVSGVLTPSSTLFSSTASSANGGGFTIIDTYGSLRSNGIYYVDSLNVAKMSLSYDNNVSTPALTSNSGFPLYLTTDGNGSGNDPIILKPHGTGNVGIGTTSPQALLDVYGTGTASAMIVPRDSTTNRPTTGINGMLRYNVTTGKLEAFASSTWQTLDTSSGSTGAFVNNGNAFGASATLGTTDSNSLSFLTNASTRMTITSSGNVGIGVSTPSVPLTVYSSGPTQGWFSSSGTQNGNIVINNGAGGYQSSVGYLDGGVSKWSTGKDTDNSYFIYDNYAGRTALRVYSSGNIALEPTGGNVGIGTTAPGTLLQIVGVNSGAASLSINTTNGNVTDSAYAGFNGSRAQVGYNGTTSALDLQAGSGKIITFDTNGAEKMRIDVNGNVGVGTTSPQALLDVYGTGTTSAILVPRASSANRPAGVAGMIRYNTDNAALEMYNGTVWSNLTTAAGGSGSYLALSGGTLTGIVAHPLGSASAPSVNFGDVTTGIYSTGSGNLSIAIASSNRVTVNATGLGIGTSAPNTQLNVYSSSASGTNLALTNADTGGREYRLFSTGSSNAAGAGSLAFYDQSAGSYRMTINSSGNVGIGLNSPISLLEVSNGNFLFGYSNSIGASANYGVGGIGFNVVRNGISSSWNLGTDTGNNGGAFIDSTVSGALRFFTIPNTGTTAQNLTDTQMMADQRMVINSAGNVGIGTTVPVGTLDVRTPGLAASTEYVSGKFSESSTIKGLSFGYYTNGAGTAVQEGRVRTTGSIPLALGTTNNLQAVYILDSGNVGIGTTAPNFKLDVASTTASAAIMRSTSVALTPNSNSSTLMIQNMSPTAGNYGNLYFLDANGYSQGSIGMTYGSHTGAFQGNFFIEPTSTATTPKTFVVSNTGNVGIGTTSPQVILDVNGSGASQSAMLVPRDSTAMRPTGINGMLRYNTSLSQLETYSSGAWAGLSTSAAGSGASQWTTSGSNIYYSSGNVGIGTSNPTASLTIYAGSAANSFYVNGNNTYGTNFILDSTPQAGGDSWQFSSSNSNNGCAHCFTIYDRTSSQNAFEIIAPSTAALLSQGVYAWNTSSQYASTTIDTGLSRGGSGAVYVGNGTQGSSSGTLVAANIGIGTVTPSSTVQVQGSFATALVSKNSNYSIGSMDSVILGDASSGTLTFSLPTAVGIVGRQYTIKKSDSSANTIAVSTTSSQTIDNSTSYSLSVQFQYVTLVSDGTNWAVIGQNSSSSSVGFAFTAVTGAALSTLTTSSTVTTSGSGSASLTVTGSGTPQISINGGAWTTSGTIAGGQTIAIRLTSSSSAGTPLSATVSGAGSPATFTVSTATCSTGSQTLGYTGSAATVAIPNGCQSVTVKAWGAGGGSSSSGAGGAGGYTTASYTGLTGVNSWTIKVGGAGSTALKGLGGFNGGGDGGTSFSGRTSGGGGGASTVLNGSTMLLSAAGGGGGSYQGAGGAVGTSSTSNAATYVLQGTVGGDGHGSGSNGCNAGGGGGGGGGIGANTQSCNDGTSTVAPYLTTGGTNFLSGSGTSSALNTSDTNYNGTSGKTDQPGLVYISWAP